MANETFPKRIVLVMCYSDGRLLAHLPCESQDASKSHPDFPPSKSQLLWPHQFQGVSYNAHTDGSQVISSLELSRELQTQPAGSLKSPL